jgi:hypothetical protein
MKAKYDAGGTINFYDFHHYALYFGGEGSGMVIAVDVNSATSGPNQLGKDLFAITILYDEAKGYYLALLGAPGTKGANDNTKGSSGCSPDIGEISANQLYQAAGAGCSYYYLQNIK